MSKGKIIVISGASGVGKSTVLKKVMAARQDLVFSVSATTRPPREGEVNGVHYHFISRENFLEMIRCGEFLEYDEHHGNIYGTLYSAVDAARKTGNVVLDIDPNGAMNVRRVHPDALLIFILPPSCEALEQRLLNRGDTPADQNPSRLQRAKWGIEQAEKYDCRVINDQVDDCVAEILEIIAAKAD